MGEFLVAPTCTSAGAVEFEIGRKVKEALVDFRVRVVDKNDPEDFRCAERAAFYHGTRDGVDLWLVENEQYGIEEPCPLMEVKRKLNFDHEINRVSSISDFQLRSPLIVQVDPVLLRGRIWRRKVVDEMHDLYNAVVFHFLNLGY